MLVNSYLELATARQWLYKHVSVANDAEATVEGLLEKEHTVTKEVLEVAFCAWNCSQWLAVEIVSLQAVSTSKWWTDNGWGLRP